MTAQPEVVWVYPEPYGHLGVSDESVPSGVPYVPQASLTAALAERDEAREAFEICKKQMLRALKGKVDALAERDTAVRSYTFFSQEAIKAEAECDRLKQGIISKQRKYDAMKAEWKKRCRHQSATIAERDKLAKAHTVLRELIEAIDAYNEYPPDGSEHTEPSATCEICRGMDMASGRRIAAWANARAFLTAQAAQGEKG